MAIRILWKWRYVSSLWHYLTSWSKRSLSRYGLMDHILCESRLVKHYFQWVWVIMGRWGIFLGGWRWVVADEALFWGGGAFFWGGRGWVGVCGGGYCLIIPNLVCVTSLQKTMLRIKCWEYKKVRDFLSLIQKQTKHFAGSLSFFWKQYFANERLSIKNPFVT